MEKNGLTYRDYAAFARMGADQIARDCEVQAFHASGPGGQGVNTADSAVRMRHVPTGIVVVSREERSSCATASAASRRSSRSADAAPARRGRARRRTSLLRRGVGAWSPSAPAARSSSSAAAWTGSSPRFPL